MRPVFPWVVGAAHLAFIVGLTAPAMKVTPADDPFSSALGAVAPAAGPTVYSVVSGIAELWRDGSRGLAALVGLFSVGVPALKLACLAAAAAEPGLRLWRGLAEIGRFAFVDVLVIAVLIVASRSFAGGGRIDSAWGLWVFAASAALSAGALAIARRRATPPGP